MSDTKEKLSQLIVEKVNELSEEQLIRCAGKTLDLLAEKETSNNEVTKLTAELEEARNLEKMYQQQENETRAELNELKQQLISSADTIAHKDIELANSNARLAEALNTIKDFNASSTMVDSDYELKCFQNLELPFNDSTFVEVLTTIFKERIYFTDSGKQSLSEYITTMRKSGKTNNVNEAWDIVKAIALIGYPIWFGSEAENLRGKEESTFRDKSGFNLQLHETSDTMSDTKYRKLRTFNYDNREIVSPVHIKGKIGQSRVSARVYIAIDQPTKKIVIYHFGSHLDTAKVAKSHRPS